MSASFINSVARSLVGRGLEDWVLDATDARVPAFVSDDYKSFMRSCVGGYTPDLFFHFFGPAGPVQHNALEWNRRDLWKAEYGLGDDAFCFGEDIFGNQYYFKDGGRAKVVRCLWVDDGASDFTAASFQDFLEDVVCKYQTLVLCHS